MNYQNQQIADVAAALRQRFDTLEQKQDILKAVEIKALFDQIRTLPAEERGEFGKEVNLLKQEIEGW